jgi:8-amino-7-oxononanoate synthase
MIDDAHSTGVIGKGGRGTASEFSLDEEVDIIMGTFSKTFSSLGGFVGSERAVINFIKHHSPALIFSASPTPSSVAAAEAALDILRAEPERIKELVDNANKMRKGFKDMGFEVIDGRTAVVPVILGDDPLVFKFWRKLFDAGVFVNAFISPGVPPSMAMLRTSYMATHEDVHLNKILEVFNDIGREMKIID